MVVGPSAEESRALSRAPAERRLLGAYYTPLSLVETVLDAVAPLVPQGPLAVIDPACGAGAFLVAARGRWPRASLWGMDLSEDALAQCRARLPEAHLEQGDSLMRSWPLPAAAFQLWVGNPPYNGTSALLREPVRYRALCQQLAHDARLPAGTSLRDDFVFFLLRGRAQLRTGAGALAYLTPATWLDSFLYSPVREALLRSLSLRQVLDLGSGLFQGTRVRTCLTVWSSELAVEPRYRMRSRPAATPEALHFHPPQPLRPTAPDFLLRPVPPHAQALETRWRAEGQALTELIPVSLPGLKTRFDELLVDDDPDRLLSRVGAFLSSDEASLPAFAESFALPPRVFPKLRALHRSLPPSHPLRTACVRPFFRYQGARHRGLLPDSSRAFCYLDRALIPRGDHRLRGAYDPHAEPLKLLFNVRESPLSAALSLHPGCVHDHRHARFAPLRVPARLLREGLGAARREGPLGPAVLNLSPLGHSWLPALGGVRAFLGRLIAFLNGEEVQQHWAPAFGTLRVVPVSRTSLANTPGWEEIAHVIPADYELDP